MGRFYSLDLNHCIGGLGRFLLKERKQGTVDFKSLLPPTKGIKKCVDHIEKKRENYTWTFLAIYKQPTWTSMKNERPVTDNGNYLLFGLISDIHFVGLLAICVSG